MSRVHRYWAPDYTHAELIPRAVSWLRLSKGCVVVHTRGSSTTSEQPDAIGWQVGGWSVLIECKASRGDFKRDSLKPHRKTTGVGAERWFMTPADLLKAEEIPPGWGLLEAYRSDTRVKLSASTRGVSNMLDEIVLLVNYRRSTDSCSPGGNS